MYQDMVKMTPEFMAGKTAQSRKRQAQLIEIGKVIEHDLYNELRKKEQECRACFYTRKWSRIGGMAITIKPCMCCGELMQFPSTCTDALCPDCAAEHDLCKHCGGDSEGRIDRTDWPEPVKGETECI